MPFKDKLGRICGFLDIDEDDKRKRFLRRYFILNKTDKLLEWYMDSPSNLSGKPKPCGVIKLDYITKVDEAKKMKIEFCFVINTPFRPYYVQANTHAELEEWVEILNDASKIVVPPEAMHPPVSQEGSFKSKTNEEPREAATNYTYRTEIVGNVVMKKKISESKLRAPLDDQSMSPSVDSIHSEFKYSLSPASPSLRPTFFNVDDEDECIKKGWGVKQGHVRKNWKRRFFILKQQGFAYYKSDHDREPIRTILTAEILTVKEDDSELSRQRDNLFLVATTDKPYYIQADTPSEMKSWILAFNDAIRRNSRQSSRKHQASRRRGNNVANKTSFNQDDIITGFASLPPSRQLKKQTSAAQLACTPLQSGPGYGSNTAPGKSKKGQKTHRRGGSEVSALLPHAFEVTPIQIGNSLPITYDAEDMKARPESVNYSALPNQLMNIHSSSTASASISQSLSNKSKSSRNNSDVDTRCALKPSAVKKKKPVGIMFKFNAMLSKKQDRIEKERSRFYHT